MENRKLEEKFTQTQVVKLARRLYNSRRSYLWVNPFQAKHIPTKPHIALSLMRILADKLRINDSCGSLVIGFAETATAIGAVVAAELNAYYLPTTREKVADIKEWLDFSEEHSHAQQQQIALKPLKKILDSTENIIFIDDELSTGKTVRNLVKKIKEYCMGDKRHRYVAACFIERLNDTEKSLLRNEHIELVALFHGGKKNYEERAKSINVQEAVLSIPVTIRNDQYIDDIPKINPRRGTSGGVYFEAWNIYANKFIQNYQKYLSLRKKVLVLGTEECMLPGLLIANALEKVGVEVYSQATTRSPIGISSKYDYPIRSGWEIRSLYDEKRVNYVYNLQKYDVVIVVSDAENFSQKSMDILRGALVDAGNYNFIWIGDREK